LRCDADDFAAARAHGIGQVLHQPDTVSAVHKGPFLVRQRATQFAGVEFGYRNGWWVPNDHELFAMGRFGQLMLVSPATRTVIVRLGRDGHNGSSGLGFDGEGETNISIVRRLERVVTRLPSPR